MKTSFPRLPLALIIISTIISLTCMEAKAQSNVLERLFHGGTYENQSARQTLYDHNDQLPLRGLFAPGFTRTLTVLGGFNFPSEGVDDIFEQDFAIVPVESLFSPPPARSLDDTGYAISFAFGRRHSRKLRSEIEVAFRSNEITQTSPFSADIIDSFDSEVSDGSVSATSLMKNFIRDFDNNSLFTPYVGFGIGLSYIDVEFGEAISPSGEAIFQEGEALFSYQAIGGVTTKLNSFSDFVVEYRFLGTSEIEFAGLSDALAYNTSTLFMGLKFEY